MSICGLVVGWRVHSGPVMFLTAIVLLAQAVIAKNVLDVELDFFSQFAPLYVYIAYQVSQLRTRSAEIAFDAAIVLVSVAVLTLYGAT